MNDYNPYGGTSQSVINEYHRQMADIDKQLLETGKYVGPVYNPKTKSVEVQELDKAKATRLKNALWNQADKLEGYAPSERHQKGLLRSIGAWFVRKFKGLNPVYQIKKFIAWRDQRKLDINPYARDMLYGNMYSEAPEKKTPQEPEKQEPIKKQDNQSRNNEPKTPQAPPAPAKNPVEQDLTPVRQQPQENQRTEETNPAPEQKDNTKKEKPDYQAKFYQDLDKRMADSGMTKEDAIISLIEEKPIRYLNLKEEDITKNVATKAVLANAAAKNQTALQSYRYLTSRVAKTAIADTRANGMENTFKAIPTLIEQNPDVLNYLIPSQITKQTAQFLVSDIIGHAQKDGRNPIEAQEQFADQLLKISSPAADKLKEHLISMSPPTQTSQMKADHWRQDKLLNEKALEIEDRCESELSCYPPAVRDNIVLERVIFNNPELYDHIPEADRNLQISALAVLRDPWQIAEVPEEIELKQILDLAPEITKDWSAQELDHIIDVAMEDNGKPILNEVKEITNAMNKIATEKAQAEPVITKPSFQH